MGCSLFSNSHLKMGVTVMGLQSTLGYYSLLKLRNSNYNNAAVSTVLSRVRAKGGFGILYTLLKPKASALL